MVLKRAVILTFYYTPNGLTSLINTQKKVLKSERANSGETDCTIAYSLSDGGGWSKMKVSFSVSSQLISESVNKK